MELYLHQDGEQVGPYSEEQISSMLTSGALSRDDLVWHEGLTEWQPLHAVFTLPAPVAPPAPARQVIRQTIAEPQTIMTNVKQGAIIGGWVCFGLGIICMVWSLVLFFLYGPFFLVAFILSIVAMSQRRVMGGIALLVATLLVPTILGAVLFTSRAAKFADDLSKSLDTSTTSESRTTSSDSEDKTERPTGIADAMRKGFEDAQRESDLKTLTELREQKAEYDKKLQALNSFRVLSANFSKEENAIGMSEPVIAISVQNDTGFAVKRASFRGVLASPGRSIPWVDDGFSYEIKGGLEPGEKADWRLAPNMFGDWGKVESAPDARFTVTVTGLNGADDKELFGDIRFGEHDAKRLAELEKKYSSEQDGSGQPATRPESE